MFHPVYAEVSVKPLSICLAIEPGNKGSSILTVQNDSLRRTNVKLKAVDWWRTPRGDLKLQPPGSRDRSSAEWVKYSPREFQLRENEAEEVTVSVSVPLGVNGDYWSMLLATEKPIDHGTTSNVEEPVGYAIKILVEDPNNPTTAMKAKIQNIRIVNTKPLKINVYYQNTGTVHLKSTGKLEIRDIQGETKKEFEVKEFPTLPGEEHIISFNSRENSEPLNPGTYYVIVVMNFGGDHLIQGGLPIKIPSGK